MRRFFVFAPLVACLLSVSPAQAQSAADKAAARALADDADAALAAKNFGTAVEKYQKALLLVPDALTLRLGLARAQAGVGKFLEATESYNQIVRAQLSTGSPAPFRAAQKDAEREISETSTRIGAVVVTLVVPSNKRAPLAPTLSIDDEPIPAALIGERRPANPGRHTIRFKADGWEPAEARVEVKEGSTSPVSITLVASAPAPTTPAPQGSAAGNVVMPPPAGPTEPTAATSSNRLPAYVALGLGGAGVVVGTVAGVVAISKHGALKDKCLDGCPPGSQSDIDGYRASGAVSTIGFVVGGVGLTTGAVLWLLAPASGPTTAATTTARSRGHVFETFTPYVGPTGLGAFGSF